MPSFGLIVGSKKFAIKGREFYQSNFLEHFPSHQENAFGYNASYWSVSKEIYAWHMKERGLRHVVLIDGYKKIGRNHSDTSIWSQNLLPRRNYATASRSQRCWRFSPAVLPNGCATRNGNLRSSCY
jgi:hypothetical protein